MTNSNDNKEKSTKCTCNFRFYFFLVFPFMCLSLIAAVASVIALTQNTLYYEFNTLSKEVFEYKRVSNNKWSEIDNNIKQIQSDLGNIKTKVWFQKKKIGTIENEITQLFDVVITIGNNIQIIKNAECNELFKDKILCNTDAFVEDFPISTQKDGKNSVKYYLTLFL